MRSGCRSSIVVVVYSDETRKERRVPTDSPALVYKPDDPDWRTTARVANVSANGLLLKVGSSHDELAVGARIDVRFGATAVAGKVRHVSHRESELFVGLAIDDVQYL
jgi:hypothetical protein